MKFLLVCFSIIILHFQSGFSQSPVYQNINIEGKYKICRIDTVESIYIIYAQKGNPIVKIASTKDSVCNCEPIVIGQYYDLDLESRLNFVAGKLSIGGMKVNGVLIPLEGDRVIWDLFRCRNLKGLCIFPQTDVLNKKKE
ncbi:hypothetical protein [Chitinophaga sp. CF418]|uniref:hypothetical protein n=1 Tax=Chitinophaga sp. CF418 TaxID=1855287 RepID=UPI0009190A4A|nr:hypothetical protein [Chitinophaga sp. CF418]SHN46123.1 hypothetical protein SAMN05216311_12314 [Chitinophaga sp. CF418]